MALASPARSLLTSSAVPYTPPPPPPPPLLAPVWPNLPARPDCPCPACLQGLRSDAFALREQLQASQAETRALRAELVAARTKMETAEQLSVDLQE
jgi:hypothetical protein